MGDERDSAPVPQEEPPGSEECVQSPRPHGPRPPEVDKEPRRAGCDRLLELLTEPHDSLARNRFRRRDQGEEDWA